MSSQNLPTPDYAKNMKLIGHTDQGGRPDGVQLMVNKGFAITGHMFSKGFSVIDVRAPRDPKPVNYTPAPPNTWNIHLQTHGDLLLVINAKDMFAAAEFQDETQYYKGALGEKVGTADAVAPVVRDQPVHGCLDLARVFQFAPEQGVGTPDRRGDTLRHLVLQRDPEPTQCTPAGNITAHGAGADDMHVPRPPGAVLAQ